jgi:PAS domain S-box-containing protein
MSVFDINPEMTPEEWDKMWMSLPGKDFCRFESVHRHPDGTHYPVDIIKYSISFNDEEYSCTIARDITERKQSEEDLRESEGRLRTLIQTLPDLVWLKDEHGVYQACNSMFERFFGAKEHEIVGKTDYDFVDRELADFFRENDRRAALAGKPTVNEEWITFAADGRRALLETIKTPLYATEGTVAGVLGIGRDITDRKLSEEAIREANRKLNLLSSITRHDILNQITGAGGYLEMLELDGEIPPGTRVDAYLKKIAGAVETIERQIQFTGYYKDLGEQAPDWFDVGRIIETVGTTSSFTPIHIQNDIEDIEVFADPLFEKVIYNLIDNAVKHGETITQIVFSSVQRPDELVIVCEDDGVGIPADAKEKIFRREYFKNSGLGLFLSGEILAITGLTITETGTPGRGARFEVHVPKGMFRKSASKGSVDE